MKKFLLHTLSIVIGMLITAFLIIILGICLFTPEKTKHGTYTNIYKYWTDKVYVCRNFNCPVEGVKND